MWLPCWAHQLLAQLWGGRGEVSPEDESISRIEYWVERQSSDRRQKVKCWAPGRLEMEILYLCLLFLGLDFEKLVQLSALLDDRGYGPSHVVTGQQLGPETSPWGRSPKCGCISESHGSFKILYLLRGPTLTKVLFQKVEEGKGRWKSDFQTSVQVILRHVLKEQLL